MGRPYQWAGNAQEKAVKRRGWGFYASHIGAEGSVYMERYILKLPFNLGAIRLHHIMRSDDDSHLHDHPFDFVSLLLTGGYTETIPCPHPAAHGCIVCKDGTWSEYKTSFSIIRKKAEDLHRLTLRRPLWTLVFAQNPRRAWGFAPESGWVHNEDYFKFWQNRKDWVGW